MGIEKRIIKEKTAAKGSKEEVRINHCRRVSLKGKEGV